MQPQPPPPPGRGFPDWLFVFLDGLAYSLEVLCHRDIGERRCRDSGGRLLLVLALGLALSVLADERQLRRDYFPMLCFSVLVVTAHCDQRLRARRRRQEGEPGHSYYTGRPRLLNRWPNLDELTCKRLVEPALWIGLGVLALVAGMPHPGIYLVASGIALHVRVAWRDYWERELALDVNDGLYDLLTHQERAAAEQGRPDPTKLAAAASVRPSAPPPPVPAQPPAPPLPGPPAVTPSACVPDHLRGGLGESLTRLLDEPFPQA